MQQEGEADSGAGTETTDGGSCVELFNIIIGEMIRNIIIVIIIVTIWDHWQQQICVEDSQLKSCLKKLDPGDKSVMRVSLEGREISANQ